MLLMECNGWKVSQFLRTRDTTFIHGILHESYIIGKMSKQGFCWHSFQIMAFINKYTTHYNQHSVGAQS